MSQPSQSSIHRSQTGRPDLFSLLQANPERYPFLLESTAQQTASANHTARYDILFCFPQQTLIKRNPQTLTFNGQAEAGPAFLAALDKHWRAEAIQQTSQTDLPFRGGWFVYLGYELAGEIEPGLQLPDSQDGLPVALATRIPVAVVYDHHLDSTHIVAEPGYSEYLDIVEQDLARYSTHADSADFTRTISLTEDEPQEYLDNTRRVLDYIREGDVFQVNLSRRWQGVLSDSNEAFGVYRQLRQTNPAPFAGFACLEAGAILSSSPERLVRVRGRRVDTRPIAGTRPRMQTAEGDESIQDELIRHPKERAEHVMLLDLERNDLGRLCRPGSVQVDEMMVIESYAHVHHIVSNVCGELREDITPGQVIAAVFPGGTITGCPKVRCMEIIAELEQCARGPYTGAFGYLNHNGDMDLNILIRSFAVRQNQIVFRTGAGLVADSNPELELQETRAKAKGLILALQGASQHALSD